MNLSSLQMCRILHTNTVSVSAKMSHGSSHPYLSHSWFCRALLISGGGGRVEDCCKAASVCSGLELPVDRGCSMECRHNLCPWGARTLCGQKLLLPGTTASVSAQGSRGLLGSGARSTLAASLASGDY